MLITDQPVLQRISSFVEAHNAAQQRAAHRITSNRFNMLRAIARLSILEARRVVTLPDWADSDTLPTVYTRRKELARLVGCGERTVYNCISLLERAGLVKKQLHGRQNDFELTLHPWFIFEASYQAPQVRRLGRVDKSVESPQTSILPASPTPISLDSRQNLPPISSRETKEPVVIFCKSGVDCGKSGQGHTSGAPLHNPRQVDDKRIDKRTDAGPRKAETPPSQRGPVTTRENPGPESHQRTHQLLSIGQLLPTPTDAGMAGESPERPPSAPAPASHSSQPPTAHMPQPNPQGLAKELTRQFWRLAKEQLWPNDYIAEGSDYEIRLLNLIWNDVMGGFRDCTTPGEVTTRYFLRESQLKLATTYARKHGWTSFLPPPLYFSLSQYKKEKLSNARGCFHWTCEWIKDTDARQKHRKRQEELQRALHSVIAQVPPKIKGGRSMSRIQIYQYWNHRLGRLGDARLLDAFNEQVAQHLPQN